MVTAADYPQVFGGAEGFPAGIDGYRIADEVRKAMEATGAVPRSGPGANALELEDALPQLKSAEIRRAKQLNLWKAIPKRKAYGLTAEGTRTEDLGDFGAPGFIGGNDSGTVTDATYTRWFQSIKYMAVLGEITLPTTLIRTIGYNGVGVNAEQTQDTNKMDELLRHVERQTWFGDEDLHSEQWNGLKKQICDGASTGNGVRLDLRGAAPNKDLLENLTYIAHVNSTDISHFYWPHDVLRDLKQSLYDETRIPEGYRGLIGNDFDRFMVEALGGEVGSVELHRNHMLTHGVKGGRPRFEPTSDSVSSAAPSAPSAVSGAAAAHTASDFRPGLAAGTYSYGVAAIGKGGRSLATEITATVTPTAGQKVTLTIVDTDPNVLYYEVYRNPAGTLSTVDGNRRFLCTTARSGNTTTFDDDGYAVPDTTEGCALYIGEDEIQFNQLLPVVKRKLPIALMAERFAYLIFGTPVVQVPTHNIWVTNIGRRLQNGVYST